MKNASKLDFIGRSSILANKKRSQSDNRLQVIIKSYFIEFNADGMFYGSGTNMTFQNITDQPPCPKSKYNLDSRCQEHYVISSFSKNAIGGYPPTRFLYDENNEPYIACGLCKRISMPDGFMVKYNKLFDMYPQLNAFSNICNSVYLPNLKLSFENIGQKSSIRILIDPYTLRLAFQSDYTLKRNEIITIKESYINRLDSEKEKKYFIDQINDYYKNNKIKICSSNRTEIYQIPYNQTKGEFSFFHSGKEFVVLQEFTFIIDKIKVLNSQGQYETQFCYLNNLLLLTVMSKDQLRTQAIILEDNLDIIEIVFRVTMYCTISLSLVVSFFNTKKISNMLNCPVEHLTSILKKLKVDEETKNYILFEDGMLNGDFQIETQELFLSSDMHFLYESFQNLFQTLIFTTQNMFDQDECLSLIQLSKQISYFKQIRNYRALGICYNNIGNIHSNNCRFQEALENYNQAIVYCNYELNYYEETTLDQPRRIFFDQSKVKLAESDFGYKLDRKSTDQMQMSNSKKKLKFSLMKLSFMQAIKRSFVSKSNQQQKQNMQKQDSLLKCLNQYGMETSQREYQHQTEIYWQLFNRKFNSIKTLVLFMLNKQNALADFDIAETLLTELKNISNFRLPQSHKRDILLNSLQLTILQKKNDLYESEKIIEENQFIEEQIKGQTNKQFSQIQQQVQQQNQLQNQKSPVQKFNLLNSTIPHNTQSNANQNGVLNSLPDSKNNVEKCNILSNIQNNLLAGNNNDNNCQQTPNQLSSLNQSNNNCNSIQSPLNLQSQSTQNNLLQNIRGAGFGQPIKFSNCQSSSPIKIKNIQRKQVGFSPKDQQSNFFQQIQGSPQSIKKPFQYLRSIISKKSSNLEETCNNIDSPVNNNQGISFYSHVEDSFSGLNPNHSPQQPTSSQYQNNMLDTQKDESPTKKKFPSFRRPSVSTMQFSPQPHFQVHKNVYDWVNGKQKKNLKSKLQNNPIAVKNNEGEEALGSRKSRKSFVYTMNSFNNYLFRDPLQSQNVQQIMGEQSTRSKRNKQNQATTSERFKSNSRLNFDCNQDEINQYEFNNDIIHGIILDQISTVYLMKNNFYSAAETITKFFEEPRMVLPYMQYKSFRKLISILEKFGLTHPQLEQMYQQLNSDISFKINVVYIDLDDDSFNLNPDLNNKQNNFLETSYFSYQTQGNYETVNEIEKEKMFKKQKILHFCEFLIDQVIQKDDDYFGFITSYVRDMSIKENIAMISKAQIYKNMGFIKKELYNFFSPPLNYQRRSRVNQTIDQDEIQTPSPIRKMSRSLQFDKKKETSPLKRLSNTRESIYFDKSKQNSPSSFHSLHSGNFFAEKRKKSPSAIKIPQNNNNRMQIQALQNMLLQNHRQNENYKQKSFSSNLNLVSDPQLNTNKSKSIFKQQKNSNQNQQNLQYSSSHNNSSQILKQNSNNLSKRTTIQIDQKSTNLVFTSQSQMNDCIQINNNSQIQQATINDNNSNFMMLSGSNVNRSEMKFINSNQCQEKHLDLLEIPIINISSNGYQTPQGQNDTLKVSQTQVNQKESINNVLLEDNFDESIKIEKEQMYQLSPILEEISRRNINIEDLKRLQKFSLYQSSSNQDSNKLTVRSNPTQDVLHTFTNWVNTYANSNISQKQQLSSSTSILQTPPKIQQGRQRINSSLPQSQKKQFLPIQQISLIETEEGDKLKSLADLQNKQLMKKKRELFYFTIRKALQQVTSQYDGKSISLQLNTLYNQFMKNISQNVNHIHKQDRQCSKKHFIHNNLHSLKHDKKYFKKFIIAIIDDMSIIDQNEDEFNILINNLKNLQVELCILMQNEGLSIKEGNEYTSKIVDGTYMISYFHCEQNLLLYLISSRCSKYHDCIPLIVEHF